MLKRIALSIAALAALAAPARAEQIGINHTEVVSCQVVAVSDTFHSFLPPEVGDTIVFDLSKPQIDNLEFQKPDGGWSYIPHSSIPKVNVSDPWQTHRAFYTLNHDPVFGDATQVIIGAYGNINDPIAERPWAATIQKLVVPEAGEWSLQHMSLTCTLISP